MLREFWIHVEFKSEKKFGYKRLETLSGFKDCVFFVTAFIAISGLRQYWENLRVHFHEVFVNVHFLTPNCTMWDQLLVIIFSRTTFEVHYKSSFPPNSDTVVVTTLWFSEEIFSKNESLILFHLHNWSSYKPYEN